VEIKAEGNVALGIGASFDFGIEITENRLAINCKASLVFGPGAGGGFGTAVDIEKIGDLIYVLCNALSKADFHYQLAITEEAFKYMARGLFQIITQPGETIGKAFSDNANDMRLWWKKRVATKQEAQNTAAYLLKNKTIKVNSKSIPVSLLPPETVGPIIYLLTESFVESWAEEQEKAVVFLLSHIRTWRHFIHVLEHCSSDGKKVDPTNSLNRINALLDGHEQLQFNRFIKALAANNETPLEQTTLIAWQPTQAWRKEKTLLAAKRSGLFDRIA
jgi:hypothetical protein